MTQDDARWHTAQSLLAHPESVAAAVAETGLFTEMPPELAALTPRRLTGKTALDVVTREDRTAVIDSWESVRATGDTSFVVELQDGDARRPMRMHFLDLRGRFGIYLGVCVPTDEAPTRQATTAREDTLVVPRFARVVKNQMARFTEVDEATTQLLGWSREELLGERSLAFVHPDDQDLAVASWMELLGAPGLGRRVRLRHVRKDGSYAWFEVTNYNFLDDPERGYVSCEIVDISDEMAAQEAVRSREQLLQRLAEALPVGVMQLAADGTVLYSNRQLTDLLTRQAQSFADVVEAVAENDRDRAGSTFAAVLGGCEATQAEVQLAVADGRYCSISVRRLDDGAGTTTGAVVCVSDITDSTRLGQELRHRATVDPLTNVLNRAGITDVLNAVWQAPGTGVAVLFVDLDGFKAVNDEFGHETGDRLLVAVADVLQRSCRATDAVGRLGGDEFLVVCGDVTHDEASAVRARVVKLLASSSMPTAGGRTLTAASVGLAWTVAHGTTPDELVARADVDMYAAKAERRGADAAVISVPGARRSTSRA